MILFLFGFILGIFSFISILKVKDWINEFMYMKYHDENPTPEQVIAIGEAMAKHHDDESMMDIGLKDNGETANSYQ